MFVPVVSLAGVFPLAASLGLAEGKIASAVIKASSVMIAVD